MTVARTVAQVNRALERAGFHGAEVVRGDGYLWFDGPETCQWYTSSVPVCYLNHLSVEQWVEAYRRMHEEHLSKR